MTKRGNHAFIYYKVDLPPFLLLIYIVIILNHFNPRKSVKSTLIQGVTMSERNREENK